MYYKNNVRDIEKLKIMKRIKEVRLLRTRNSNGNETKLICTNYRYKMFLKDAESGLLKDILTCSAESPSELKKV